ncbi:MAG: YqhA family protein [Candidatus Nanopelagicales bacterium]|jgi:uncharacterized membrane protein YqhA|nr:YqhA family protein [Candidatus Nanopelagicales bacterium]
MRRLIEVSRFVVIVPALAAIVGAIVLMILGSVEILRAALGVVVEQVPLKETIVDVLASIDAILLGTVLLVIGYGLYELFVDTHLDVPDWLEINNLDDLKAKLIGVIVAIIAVIFVGELVDADSANDVMYYGIGSGAVVIALAAFSLNSKK